MKSCWRHRNAEQESWVFEEKLRLPKDPLRLPSLSAQFQLVFFTFNYIFRCAQEIGIQQTVAEMTQTNRSSILVPLRPAKRKMERTLEVTPFLGMYSNNEKKKLHQTLLSISHSMDKLT